MYVCIHVCMHVQYAAPTAVEHGALVQRLQALEDLDEVDPDDALVDVLPALHVAVLGLGSVLCVCVCVVCVCILLSGVGGVLDWIGGIWEGRIDPSVRPE